ncbi:hypothetical protein [Sphingopyxis sp.]|uniref:hypothetical protein n=1 Tax=Sphingopyxis sp. TaxID=1908224 RepID=UPI0025FA3555|nr:hypothetical protein [Sphingopyxis sp.]MBK6413980.1 hypothetical protein [Sphingopyxis sp.]
MRIFRRCRRIRDDVAILRANRIETLTPMLFLMLAATTYLRFMRGRGGSSAVRIGFPVILAAVGILGFPVPHAQSRPQE